jgi:hypothetical protein
VDPGTALGSITGQIVATILAAAVLGMIAWLAGPLRWWVSARQLRTLLLGGRRFNFVFNPMTGQNKVLTFLENGDIGEGRNSNESTWRIKRGALEILASDGLVYSRFRHDASSGQLRHTNEAELRSIHGQYIHPLLIRGN